MVLLKLSEVSLYYHNFSFHTAGKNKTNQLRIALANTYFADGAKINKNLTIISGDLEKIYTTGVKPGGIAASKLNPICWPTKNIN